MSIPARAEADRGAVTVEAAIALSALTLVLGLVLAGIAAMAGQLRCADAAREAARLVARGDRPLAEQAVAQIAPGARLRAEVDGNAVTVDVTAEPIGGLLPGVHLHGHAFSLLEPGVPDAPG
ncbi:TadE family type IV pilus minor pilin [Amycolatopsis pithecellobii]|uniref:Pilus assembly protein n=1 Tax=Amycolatopsis pithecellobii TaxID=664692 RepID=A0A6N7ZCW7_9PSEU|nr:TadE family type IV pilus minor pilin [Amycolatopsis pithecellobii]MTD59644.1 pilus assembly protein [Amycolatopsis pithecellobii]